MRHKGSYGCQIRKNSSFRGAHEVKICFCTKKLVFNRCLVHPLHTYGSATGCNSCKARSLVNINVSSREAKPRQTVIFSFQLGIRAADLGFLSSCYGDDHFRRTDLLRCRHSLSGWRFLQYHHSSTRSEQLPSMENPSCPQSRWIGVPWLYRRKQRRAGEDHHHRHL
jgi:hypothetical protein